MSEHCHKSASLLHNAQLTSPRHNLELVTTLLRLRAPSPNACDQANFFHGDANSIGLGVSGWMIDAARRIFIRQRLLTLLKGSGVMSLIMAETTDPAVTQVSIGGGRVCKQESQHFQSDQPCGSLQG